MTHPQEIFLTVLVCFAPLLTSFSIANVIDPFQKWRHVTSRDFANWRASKQIVCVSEDRIEGNLEVFAQWWTFVLCLAAQIVRIEKRTKDVIVFAKSCRDRSPKSKLWASNVERLSSPVLEGRSCSWRYWILQSLRPFYIRYLTWCKALSGSSETTVKLEQYSL